jgi:SAM-dependent methyltransferase
MSAPPSRVVRAVSALKLRANDTVLEVGCGNGQGLALMTELVTTGCVIGIDRSPLQVQAARARNRSAIAKGRVRVEQLTLDDAPAALNERFAKIVAVNVNVFWTSPELALPSVKRMLRARGCLYLSYEAPSPARARAIASQLPELLKKHDFGVVLARLDGSHCAVSAKPLP